MRWGLLCVVLLLCACSRSAELKIDASSEMPVTLDRKLGVPDSCRRIGDTCIMPVLVELVREGME
jgi:hypothetical protein